MIRQLLQPGCRYSDIMKRTVLTIALLLAALLDQSAVWAQHRPNGGSGQGRNVEARHAQPQQAPRNDPNANRGNQQANQQNIQQNNQQNNQQNSQQNSQLGGQRMSPEERRQLRDQVRDHGRDIYRDPGKR